MRSENILDNLSAVAILKYMSLMSLISDQSPTLDEIGQHCYLSRGYVSKLVKRLAKAGHLTKNGRRWRGIDIPPNGNYIAHYKRAADEVRKILPEAPDSFFDLTRQLMEVDAQRVISREWGEMEFRRVQYADKGKEIKATEEARRALDSAIAREMIEIEARQPYYDAIAREMIELDTRQSQYGDISKEMRAAEEARQALDVAMAREWAEVEAQQTQYNKIARDFLEEQAQQDKILSDFMAEEEARRAQYAETARYWASIEAQRVQYDEITKDFMGQVGFSSSELLNQALPLMRSVEEILSTVRDASALPLPAIRDAAAQTLPMVKDAALQPWPKLRVAVAEPIPTIRDTMLYPVSGNVGGCLTAAVRNRDASWALLGD